MMYVLETKQAFAGSKTLNGNNHFTSTENKPIAPICDEMLSFVSNLHQKVARV